MEVLSIVVVAAHYPCQSDLGGLGSRHMTLYREVGFEEDVQLKVSVKTGVRLRFVFNAKFEFLDYFC